MLSLRNILSAAALLACVPAWAQVQQVYNNHTMDANPQVGSGGSNHPIQGYTPVNGNDIITGNVAGLKYFHGNIPYRSQYSFGAPLGSSSLGGFARQSSTGSAAGQPYTGQTTPYYLPSATVTGAQGTIGPNPYGNGFESRTVPGTSYSASSGRYEPINNLDVAVPINGAVPYRMFDRPGETDVTPLQPSGLYGIRVLPRYANQATTTQPGKKDPLQGDDELPLRTDNGVTEERNQKAISSQALAARLDARVRATPENAFVGRTNPLTAEDTASDVYQGLQTQIKPKSATPGAPASGDAGSTTQPGGTGVKTEIDPLTGQPRVKRKEKNVEFQSSDPTKPFYRPAAIRPISEEPTEKLKAGKDIKPIETFHGKSPSLFNHYMKIAEGQLKQGRYIDAAETYQDAGQFAPDNPLTVVGRAHAQLAAGMYADSAADLKLLFERKPELVAVHYDLVKFLPEKRVDFLREDLTKLSHNVRPNATANFLLAYLYYQMGNGDAAKNELNYLKEQFKRDPWPDVLLRAWIDEAPAPRIEKP